MQRLRTRLRAGVSTFPPATFALNFLTGGLDSRITFTRGSNATLVDSTGKITYAPANLVTYSEQFDNAAWTLGGATISANATAAPSGASTADKLVEDASTGSHNVFQTGLGAAGAHTFSAFVKAAERNWIVLRIEATDTYFNVSTGAIGTVAAGNTATIANFGNGWYRCTVTRTMAAAAAATLRIATADGVSSYTGTLGSGIFLYGAQMEQVTYQTTPGTYNPTTTAAYYGPRFDYDPVTLAAKGLLIEEQRTNIILQSQTFGTTWTYSGTLTADATAGPDGTTTADLVSNTGSAAVSQSPTLALVPYTISLFVKASTASQNVVLRFAAAGGTAFSLRVNAETGVVTNSGTEAFASVGSQSFGNGWYRVWGTATPTTTDGRFQIYPNAGIGGFTGSTSGNAFIYGAQLEAGAFATSYIPTVASQVTRSADVATMTGTNFSSWYNQSEGTFVASFDQNAVNSEVGYVGEVRTDNNNRIQLFANNGAGQTQLTVRNGGVLQADLSTAGSITQGAVVNAAYAYKASDFAAVRGGGTVATALTGTIPAVTSFLIGFSQVSSNLEINGHIRQIAYYNTRLPNATLQSLTA